MGITERCILKIVIIAGSGKRTGKTLLATHLIRKLKQSRKTVAAYKLKHLDSGESSVEPGAGRKNSDTYRYKQAGAKRVAYIQFSTEEELKSIADEKLLGFAEITICESNTLRSVLTPDILVYLNNPSDVAKNPELAKTADVICDAPLSKETAERVAETIAGLLGCGTFTLGGKYWISKNDEPLFGEGIFHLLRTIEETGSIHGASLKIGIPYKRVWILINKTETKLGAKLLLSNRGGVSGGGSTLTPMACRLLNAFEIAAGLFRKFKHGLEI